MFPRPSNYITGKSNILNVVSYTRHVDGYIISCPYNRTDTFKLLEPGDYH